MEQAAQNVFNFHLAGIVPVAGQKLDFNFPWHDCLQPIAQNYLAVERAVWECVYAGCETVWIVCHDDMQPLIRYRLGDYAYDPVNYGRSKRARDSNMLKEIPIYYVPIHPKDQDKRDCLGWSAMYGAHCAYWLSMTISKWVVPDRYYVAFPYGVYDPQILRAERRSISSKRPFFVSHEGKTVKDNEYLGFTFDAEDFKKARRIVRKEGTGEWTEYQSGERLPIEERWSGRFFTLDKIFKPVNMEGANVLETTWYYNIGCWSGLRAYLASTECENTSRPAEQYLKYHEWNPIGVDIEEE